MGVLIVCSRAVHASLVATELQSLVLRFNKGRVLAPSAKNFLLCIANEDNKEGPYTRSSRHGTEACDHCGKHCDHHDACESR